MAEFKDIKDMTLEDWIERLKQDKRVQAMRLSPVQLVEYAKRCMVYGRN